MEEQKLKINELREKITEETRSSARKIAVEQMKLEVIRLSMILEKIENGEDITGLFTGSDYYQFHIYYPI